jgi:predicted transposase YdaD
MATLNDIIMSNKVLGREYKRGLEEGKLEGMLEGELKGKLEGELVVLRRLIEKRFGAVPAWADERLTQRPTEDLEALSVRLLDAATLEELLQ